MGGSSDTAYVMAFCQRGSSDIRSLAEIASFSQARMSWLIPANATVLDEVKGVRNRVEYLEAENAKLQSKLDKIIDWINNQ